MTEESNNALMVPIDGTESSQKLLDTQNDEQMAKMVQIIKVFKEELPSMRIE